MAKDALKSEDVSPAARQAQRILRKLTTWFLGGSVLLVMVGIVLRSRILIYASGTLFGLFLLATVVYFLLVLFFFARFSIQKLMLLVLSLGGCMSGIVGSYDTVVQVLCGIGFVVVAAYAAFRVAMAENEPK